MAIDKSIKHLDLSPRQMQLFAEEDETASAGQDQLLALVAERADIAGRIALQDFVRDAANSPQWTEADILQNLIWLIHDYKVHLRANSAPLTAHEAMKMLAENPAASVDLVLHRPVETSVFERLRSFFLTIGDDATLGREQDQIEFARRLAKHLRSWKASLESLLPLASRSGFPGFDQICTCLETIKKCMVNRDGHSFLSAFDEQLESMKNLVTAIQELNDFYASKETMWGVLLQFAKVSQATLDGHLEDPELAASYDLFRSILSSSRPYRQVDQAYRLYHLLKPYHERKIERILEQRREDALTLIMDRIESMKAHLKIHAAAGDLSNRALFPLRQAILSLKRARTVEVVEDQLQAAEEAYEAGWGEVIDAARPSPAIE